MMQRRQFITLLGGAATVAWPVAAKGQQPGMPTIGLLHTASARTFGHAAAAFRRDLAKAVILYRTKPQL